MPYKTSKYSEKYKIAYVVTETPKSLHFQQYVGWQIATTTVKKEKGKTQEELEEIGLWNLNSLKHEFDFEKYTEEKDSEERGGADIAGI